MESSSSRWIAAVASIWIQCSSGASYAFGIYSPILKSTQGYHQSTLDIVSVFKDIGANAGVLSGLLYSAVAARRVTSSSSSFLGGGPWLVHVAGAVQCFAGYFLMWLSVVGLIHRPPVSAMCFFMLMAAHAQTFFNTANVVTAVHNFPDYSGTIVGIMKRSLSQSPDRDLPAENLSTLTDHDNYFHAGKEMINLLQSTRTIEFWLLFIAMLCGMGSGLATINNISQIGQSLHYKTLEINTLVSLWSIWNFLGRFGAGYISDIFLYAKGWARPLLMAFTLATMTVGHLIMASGFSGNLYVGSVLIGICYGSQWSLMPTITCDIFGVTHMGTIFNTIAIASPIGSSIFSVLVIGYIYDKEASGNGNSCYGTHCFMLSFFVLASVSLLGFLVALILFYRTRSVYAQIVVRRQKHLARA